MDEIETKRYLKIERDLINEKYAHEQTKTILKEKIKTLEARISSLENELLEAYEALNNEKEN